MHNDLLLPFATEDERRTWIRYQLARRGYPSWRAFARELGVSFSAVTNVLSGPYPHMERLIAEAIGLDPAAIWPERYNDQGRPNRPLGRPKKCVQPHKNISTTQEFAHA